MQPRNRIKRWNIVPGDKVRLLVGKPREKYMDEVRGKEGGWKVYTVSSVDMTRNRVYLNGLSVSVKGLHGAGKERSRAAMAVSGGTQGGERLTRAEQKGQPHPPHPRGH